MKFANLLVITYSMVMVYLLPHPWLKAQSNEPKIDWSKIEWAEAKAPIDPQKESMKQVITRVALEENFKDVDYLITLAMKESSLMPLRTNAKGNKPVGSVDRGLYQYNSYHQAKVSDECAFSAECSTRTTIKMIKAGKAHLWVAAQNMRKPNL